MGYHTFDASRADKLERAERRFRFCSAEELRWALGADADATVADLGSGTGFFTDVVAPHVETCHAVDVQAAMHEYYREKGVPENVELVTSGVADLPFEDDALDGAFSTMTYHEFASDEALTELGRVLTESGRLAILDWSARGSGEAGPPVEERFSAAETTAALEDHGFAVEHAAERPETFLLVAIAQ
ncbi:Methyltransferase type 11 [Salinarchaeum sp. Harcht-Bsk1]|uniref:class I SAM-dependent methyltransferase n=1 Tax=Salinarchaeum sp. Harcht-Bsk1 TaxID=1333523 RepID=UPI0003422C30|nr:class I SAM-dependent methyltransferase [Salinarchaeum sp. Harcht-Bsk1]AGN01267.1 Methyltransferase type 11 [Salinarchaeum sp. Harcht-Bsk1]